MKTLKIIFGITLLAILFTSCSSTDINSDTIVNENGSCTRILKIKGDSACYKKISYPVEFNSTWKIAEKIEEDTAAKKKVFVYTLVKNYQNVNDLNKDFSSKNDTLVNREVNFQKKFRWFYTEYVYLEKFKKLNNLSIIPPEYYLSNEDIEILKEKGEEITEDSTKNIHYRAITDKIVLWLNRSAFEIHFNALVSYLEHENKYKIDLKNLKDSKESLFSEVPTAWLDAKEKILAKVFEKIIPPENFNEIWEKQSTEMESQKLNVWNNMLSRTANEKYNNSVEMPGKIISTNSKLIENNKVSWNIKYLNFYFSDYEMTVKSRKINLWSPFVSAGLLALLVVGGILVRRKRIQ